MRKLMIGMSVAMLFLTACGEDTETADDQVDNAAEEASTEPVGEAAEEQEGEMEQEAEETVAVGTVNDIESIPISEYPEGNWFRVEMEDTVETRLESQAFIEGDTIYSGNSSNNVQAFSTDTSLLWEKENEFPLSIDLVMDGDVIYNHMIIDEGRESYIEALDKQNGNVLFTIDIVEYSELSELLIDDGVLYVISGKRSDPDEQTFADTFSLQAYSAEDGSERWTKEIDGMPLGERSRHYQLAVHGDLLYYVEKDNKLVARSKEDGTEVWSEQFDEGLRFAYPFISNDSLYMLDRDYVFHVYHPETGEKETEYAYNVSLLGPQIPPPVFQNDRVFYQDIDVEAGKHHVRAVDIKEQKDAWTLDLDGHYAFGVKLLNDQLILLMGDFLDEEAENPTKVAKVDPETGEILEVIELEDKLSEEFSSIYKYMGNTVHDGMISIFYQNIIYGLK